MFELGLRLDQPSSSILLLCFASLFLRLPGRRANYTASLRVGGWFSQADVERRFAESADVRESGRI